MKNNNNKLRMKEFQRGSKRMKSLDECADGNELVRMKMRTEESIDIW